MALVAYDNSDSSDYGEGDGDTSSVLPAKKLEEPIVPSTKTDSKELETSPEAGDIGLFNFLPQPTLKRSAVIEEDDEFLHKKETSDSVKPKVKITVPSLSDFKDVDGSTQPAKPKIRNGQKSGLLSILPQPRNASLSIKATTKSLIPHVLTRNKTMDIKKKAPLPTPMKKAKTDVKALADYSDDSDNEDEVQNDFFSINKPIELPAVEDIPLDIDDMRSNIKNVSAPRAQREAPNIQSYFKDNVTENHVDNETVYSEGSSSNPEQYTNNEISSTSSNYGATDNANEIVLDDEAILKLCGTRGKRKREDIQIVDVNQQEVLADAREWLLKGLMDDTSKRVSSSKKKGNEPTTQQRRKHQITYLAHQAKANEVELQNQWANNRMSKRQTQSKYGF